MSVLLTESSTAAALVTALEHLDALLQTALASLEAHLSSETLHNPHRGLYISPEDVAQLLTQSPGTSPLWPVQSSPTQPSDRLAQLQATCHLTPFDLDVLLIGLAPHLDRRYDRIYAYLQDDVTQKQPSVDLALNLLCGTFEAKLAARQRFAPSSPLLQTRLIYLVTPPQTPSDALLRQCLAVDDRIVNFLLGDDAIDPRLQPAVQLVADPPSLPDVPVDSDLKATLQAFLAQPELLQTSPVVYLSGCDIPLHQDLAAAVCHSQGWPLLRVDVEALLSQTHHPVELLLQLLHREALLQQAALVCHGFTTLLERKRDSELQALLQIAQILHRPIFLTTPDTNSPPANLGTHPIISLHIPHPSAAERVGLWQQALKSRAPEPAALAQLANQFRLSREQINRAAAATHLAAQWQGEPIGPLDLASLYAAARQQASHSLGTIAQQIQPRHTWPDLVLPTDTLTQLQEFCNTIKYRAVVHDQWGFGSKLATCKGLNALFFGPSGTGKTMAASIIARTVGLDLYAIDLSSVVSKYIGETEKNLSRIFAEAEHSNAILFFDEADALFGKRTDVRDSHDRYANLEVSYLLQRMEQYEGVVILASNLRNNIDEAFVRRIHFMISFPFPKADQRCRIWRNIWPQQVPLSPDIDLEEIAKKYELTGGNIQNAALASAFLAADDGQAVTIKHLHQALKREYQKTGRILDQDMTS